MVRLFSMSGTVAGVGVGNVPDMAYQQAISDQNPMEGQQKETENSKYFEKEK